MRKALFIGAMICGFGFLTACKSGNSNDSNLPQTNLSFMGYELGHSLSDYFPDCFAPENEYRCITYLWYDNDKVLHYHDEYYRNDTLYGRNLITIPLDTVIRIDSSHFLPIGCLIHALDDTIYSMEVYSRPINKYLDYPPKGMGYLPALLERKYGHPTETFDWNFVGKSIHGYWSREEKKKIFYNYGSGQLDVKSEGYDTVYLSISYVDELLWSEVKQLRERKKQDEELEKNRQTAEKRRKQELGEQANLDNI